jgi:DNA topoisomerase-2
MSIDNRQTGDPRVDAYKRKSLREHIYDRPTTYIGCPDHNERKIRVFDYATNRMAIKTTTVPMAVEHIFNEVEQNPKDHAMRSLIKYGVDPGTIEYVVDAHRVTITNGGYPIPASKIADGSMFAAEMIFGELLSGSNYDDTEARQWAGANGYGAKLTNVFSKEFTVIHGDPMTQRKLTVTWSNNMINKSEPIIEYYTGPAFTTVSYVLDFARFEMTHYTPEIIELFTARAIDTSFVSKCPVKFNGVELKYQKVEEYAKIIFNTPNVVIHRQPTMNTDGTEFRWPYIEVVLADTPDAAEVISFACCSTTARGGVHVESALKIVSDAVLEAFRGTKDDVKMTVNDVRPHISMVVNVNVSNPTFSDQSKTEFGGPHGMAKSATATTKVPITFPEKFFRKLEKWNLYDRLIAANEAKQWKKLKASDGKKRRHVSVKGLEDANLAGTKDSGKCVLFIVEGLSAKGYPLKSFDVDPTRRDIMGIMPIRGKFMNVTKASPLALGKNAEIAALKDTLGLREGVNYLDDHEFNTLRYGAVVLLTDADVDGHHIKCLLLNYFHIRFPSLLKRQQPFLIVFRTPILRLKTEKFYTKKSYQDYIDANPKARNEKPKYLKGLGSSNANEAKEDWINPKYLPIWCEAGAPELLDFGFNGDRTDERKTWMTIRTPQELDANASAVNVDHLINNDLLEYSLDNNWRSLPSIWDGLKQSQRMVLFAIGNVQRKKIAVLSASIIEKTHYEHGPDILNDTILRMGQKFVGALTLPYVDDDGQFGSRNEGGKDAASSRYPFTGSVPWVKKLFRPEYESQLKRVDRDGQESEWEHYLPPLPPAVFQGVDGIGTGWSTYIPPHHPVIVAEWMIARLTGQQPPALVPWFRGFNGSITIVDKHVKVDENLPEAPKDEDAPVEPEEVVEPEHEQAEEGKKSMVTRGIFREEGNIIHITELPVGRWTKKYCNYLDLLIKDGKLKTYKSYCDSDNIDLRLEGYTGTVSTAGLKLQKSYGISNYVLLDQNNRPRRYTSVYEILEEFIKIRYPYYEQYRVEQLQEMMTEIKFASECEMILQLIVTGQYSLVNKKRAQVVAELHPLGISEKAIKSIKLQDCNDDGLQEVRNERLKLEARYQEMYNRTAVQIWIDDLNDFIKAVKPLLK